ncbi:hypothetical protein YB2330_004407 [Saitoella coloradoensis]
MVRQVQGERIHRGINHPEDKEEEKNPHDPHTTDTAPVRKSGPSAYSSTNRREEARRPPSSGTGSSKQGNFGGFAWEKTSRPGAAPTSRRYEDDTNFPRGKTGSAGAGATPQGRHTKFGFDKDDKGWEKPAPKGAYTSSSRDKPIPKNVSGFSSSEEEEPKMPAFNKKKESFDPPPPHARTQGYYPSPEDEEDLYDEIRKRPVATPTSKVWPGAPSPGMKFPKTYTSPFASGTNTLNQPPPKQAPASAFTFQRSNTPEPKPMGAQASFSAPGGTGTGTGTYSFNFTGSGTTQPPPSWNAKASSTSTPSPSKHTKTHNPDRPSPYRPSGNSPKFTGPRFTGDIFGQAGMRPKEREASSHVKIPLFDFGFGAGVEGTEFNANQNGGKPRAKKGAKMGAGVDSPSTPAGGFTFSFKGGKKEGEGAEGEKTFKFDYEQWTRSFAESKKAEEAKANGQAETGTANGSRPTSSRSATGTPYEWQDDGFDEEMNDAPPMPPTEPPVPPEIPTMTPPTQIPTAPQTLNEGVFHTYLQSLLAYRLQWTEYTDQYTAYAASWHQFERLCNEEQLLFTSVADMFGKTSSEQEAARKMFEVYMEAAERNDRVREEWVEAERRHRRVLKEFNGVRLREVERVRAATEAAAAGQKSDATSAST